MADSSAAEEMGMRVRCGSRADGAEMRMMTVRLKREREGSGKREKALYSQTKIAAITGDERTLAGKGETRVR